MKLEEFLEKYIAIDEEIKQFVAYSNDAMSEIEKGIAQQEELLHQLKGRQYKILKKFEEFYDFISDVGILKLRRENPTWEEEPYHDKKYKVYDIYGSILGSGRKKLCSKREHYHFDENSIYQTFETLFTLVTEKLELYGFYAFMKIIERNMPDFSIKTPDELSKVKSKLEKLKLKEDQLYADWENKRNTKRTIFNKRKLEKEISLIYAEYEDVQNERNSLWRDVGVYEKLAFENGITPEGIAERFINECKALAPLYEELKAIPAKIEETSENIQGKRQEARKVYEEMMRNAPEGIKSYLPSSVKFDARSYKAEYKGCLDAKVCMDFAADEELIDDIKERGSGFVKENSDKCPHLRDQLNNVRDAYITIQRVAMNRAAANFSKI